MSDARTIGYVLFAMFLPFVLLATIDAVFSFLVPFSFLVEYGRYFSLALTPLYIYIAYKLYKWLSNQSRVVKANTRKVSG